MYELMIDSDFSAAHNLREYEGNCERLHGHNWKVQVRIRSRGLDKLGMAADFRDVKKHLKAVLSEFDHNYLNDMKEFKRANPTTENIARVVYSKLAEKLPKGLKLKSVTAWESEGCGAMYSK